MHPDIRAVLFFFFEYHDYLVPTVIYFVQFQPCADNDPFVGTQYAHEAMIDKINSETDTVCGLKHVLKCLIDGGQSGGLHEYD